MNKELYELSYSLRKELQQKIITLVLFGAGIFLLVNFILTFIIFPVKEQSISMKPDIDKGVYVLFSPIKRYSRGDIVLINPLNDSNNTKKQKAKDMIAGFFTARRYIPSRSNNSMGCSYLIRRVIGMPGDTIYMRGYVVYIKPAGEKYFLTEFELIKQKYNTNILAAPAGWDFSIGVNGSFESMTLGKNEYFVLGDLRNSCTDSRLWGAVDESRIRAGALAVYFPFNKIRLF